MDVGERQKLILSLIIEQYIKTGEPVGSKAIAQMLPFTISSATIRNEMSSLTEMGLLEQRHTSGGRIPSEGAYRYYINNLMIAGEMPQFQKDRVNTELSVNAGDHQRLLTDCARLLAKMTNCASFYTNVADPYDSVQGVELIPAGRSKAMLVMLTSGGIIKSSVCKIDGVIDEKFKATFYSIVRKKIVGVQLSEMTASMVQSLAVSLGDMVFKMAPVLVSLASLCDEATKNEIFIAGETNLLAHSELGDGALGVLAFLASKEQFMDAVNEQMNIPEQKAVFIGGENTRYELANSTMVLSKYYNSQRLGGVIGILGSTRLDYSNLIPEFDYITSLVDQLLSERGATNEQ